MQDSKLTCLDYRTIPLVHKFVIIKCGFATRAKNISTGRADNLEIIGEVVLSNKNKRFAIATKALKSFENDITHAFHMGGPDLV
jgi:hypothetical protein